MSRADRSLYAYFLIEPDEQLDLFACREVRVHLVARQLELGRHADRTLCGGLLPAQPRWSSATREALRDSRTCPFCQAQLKARQRGRKPDWPGF